MAKKLILRINPTLVKKAKVYAIQHGKSVSQIVEEYFSVLNNQRDSYEPLNLPLTKSLLGVLKTKI